MGSRDEGQLPSTDRAVTLPPVPPPLLYSFGAHMTFSVLTEIYEGFFLTKRKSIFKHKSQNHKNLKFSVPF